MLIIIIIIIIIIIDHTHPPTPTRHPTSKPLSFALPLVASFVILAWLAFSTIQPTLICMLSLLVVRQQPRVLPTHILFTE
jgi:hypothetical protein